MTPAAYASNAPVARTAAPVATPNPTPAPLAVVTVPVPLSTLTKAQLSALIVRKWGYTAPQGWKKDELIEGFNGVKFPKSGKAKAELVKVYQAKVGIAVVPPKGWTCEKLAIQAASPVPTLPRGKSAPGGLTVTAARKLITVAVRAGIITAEAGKGRSTWTGDEAKLFALRNDLAAKVATPVAA